MTVATLQLVRDKDGTERVLLDLEEFQVLLDAANAAQHGVPDARQIVSELKAALESGADYVDVGEFLEQYDAAHGAG